MARFGTWFWLTLASATLLAMFAVKYSVQNLETSLARMRQNTVDEEAKIHDLQAEWSYLTQPGRLAALNQRFLSLAPETPTQLEQTIADIPLRAPTPAPAPAATVAVAAAAVPQAAPASPPQAGGLAVTPVALDSRDRIEPPPARPVRAARTLDRLFAQVADGRD